MKNEISVNVTVVSNGFVVAYQKKSALGDDLEQVTEIAPSIGKVMRIVKAALVENSPKGVENDSEKE